MTAESEDRWRARLEELERENARLKAEVQGVAEANANAAELMVRLEEAREALEEKNLLICDQKDRLAEALVEAEAASHTKSMFLANMSHEFRTPLNAILGFAEMLLDPGSDPEQRSNLVGTIQRNTRHLVKLINDILDAAKIEAGKLEIERIPFSIRELVDDVIGLFRSTALEDSLTLVATVTAETPDQIVTDSNRLRQILVNVIGNSIKFTHHGEVRLTVELEGTRLVLEVRDTGIGMSPDQLDRALDPFVQADASTTRRYGGTGLGLSIAQQLAVLLDGELVMESKLGEGTTTRIRVAAGSVESAHTLPTQRTNSAEQLPADCRVLVAEDGPDNQRLIRLILERAGAEVTIVENGALACDHALESAESDRPYHVILMDMQMPVLDGYSATRRLRECDYDRPIVALTAYATSGDRERCLEAGCDDFMNKPVDRTKLVTLVRRLSDQQAQLESE